MVDPAACGRLALTALPAVSCAAPRALQALIREVTRNHAGTVLPAQYLALSREVPMRLPQVLRATDPSMLLHVTALSPQRNRLPPTFAPMPDRQTGPARSVVTRDPERSATLEPAPNDRDGASSTRRRQYDLPRNANDPPREESRWMHSTVLARSSGAY
jgi:hypothetical protein